MRNTSKGFTLIELMIVIAIIAIAAAITVGNVGQEKQQKADAMTALVGGGKTESGDKIVEANLAALDAIRASLPNGSVYTVTTHRWSYNDCLIELWVDPAIGKGSYTRFFPDKEGYWMTMRWSVTLQRRPRTPDGDFHQKKGEVRWGTAKYVHNETAAQASQRTVGDALLAANQLLMLPEPEAK